MSMMDESIGEARPSRGDAGGQQLARVETLMTIIHDVVATLSHSSSQLRQELSLLIEAGLRETSAELERTVAALRNENEQLREALTGRAVIEQAKGIIMIRCGCGPERAFDLLCELSRQQRRKVRELAGEVVAGRGETLAALIGTGPAVVVEL